MRQIILCVGLTLLAGIGLAMGQTATPGPTPVEPPPVLPALRQNAPPRSPRDIQFEAPEEPKPKAGSAQGGGVGIGDGRGYGGGGPLLTRKAVILAKPAPSYTEQARNNDIEGTVRVRVLLGADGNVKQVVPLTQLPDGLTEATVTAAWKLRFTPAQADGANVAYWIQIEYSFRLLFDEDSARVSKKPEILEKPQPEYTEEARRNNRKGKVKLLLALSPGHPAEIIKVQETLPDGLTEKAIEAARRIKFQPALGRSGKPITVVKEIEYEFKP